MESLTPFLDTLPPELKARALEIAQEKRITYSEE